ncbi:hypothetical protein SANBI_001407 [Sanguibacter sp. 4.1]|uniref:Uncharacterized protein n=1 Tax=Sanguibacter biliveldensis TaxID=3030830 RepID=A0AAF0Z6J4_9MICO|nr:MULTISPECIES: hypothetical protein [unclassified Sanguibacter]WPF83712.1 hypothetical protein SANBI_001407 [Sanguibacter sp. 4.1]
MVDGFLQLVLLIGLTVTAFAGLRGSRLVAGRDEIGEVRPGARATAQRE